MVVSMKQPKIHRVSCSVQKDRHTVAVRERERERGRGVDNCSGVESGERASEEESEGGERQRESVEGAGEGIGTRTLGADWTGIGRDEIRQWQVCLGDILPLNKRRPEEA